MENFIYETMLEDVTVCDGLIEYHKNNTEQINKYYIKEDIIPSWL